jgi:hypothetical protein
MPCNRSAASANCNVFVFVASCSIFFNSIFFISPAALLLSSSLQVYPMLAEGPRSSSCSLLSVFANRGSSVVSNTLNFGKPLKIHHSRSLSHRFALQRLLPENFFKRRTVFSNDV